MSLPIAAGPQEGTSESALTPDLSRELDEIVKKNDLVLFMKGEPDAPQCGFSMRAAQVYQALDRPFEAVNVLAKPDPMAFIQALGEWADWPTLPQCWVKGELIGGSDIALEMYESGELVKMLDE